MEVETSRGVPLLDLHSQFESIRDEVMAAVTRVFESQQFILGPEVEKLEAELAAYCQVPYAVGCGSGSDALFLALLALDVRPGDTVITVPFTFFATAGAIVRAGARPVFVDIDEATFNMDPAALREAVREHPQAKAIIPVHLYGACAEMDEILAIAAEAGIPVIEDAAQAIGSEYRGRRAGSFGSIACFSFFPTKNLGGAGEGGILTTKDEQLAQRLKALRNHGSKVRYYHDEVGVNSRLDGIQGAVLRVKLRHLDAWIARRQAHAEQYVTRLEAAGVPVRTPRVAAAVNRHIYHQFVIRAERRDALRAWLSGRKIGSEIYYPLPLHLQVCFRELGYGTGSFPVSERVAQDCLALPVYAELTEQDVDTVCDAIVGFYRAG